LPGGLGSAGKTELLVLTRKPGERVLIGPSIKMEFVGVDAKHRARLGFSSTRHLKLVSPDISLDCDMPSGSPEAPVKRDVTLAVNQKVIVNGVVEITVVAVKGEQVRVGLEAPDEIHIFREEVHAEILQESIQVAQKESELTGDELPLPSLDLEDEPPAE